MILLVLTLKRSKKHILSFGLKFVLALVGNGCTLQVGYRALVGNQWFYHNLDLLSTLIVVSKMMTSALWSWMSKTIAIYL